MRLHKYVVLLTLLCAAAAHAQAVPAGEVHRNPRILLNATTGAAVGNTAVNSEFGITSEIDAGRFEFDTSITVQPWGRKGSLHTQTMNTGEKVFFNLTPSIALIGQIDYAHMFTAAYEKHAFNPWAGIAFHNNWQGYPGRFEVKYLFPTGCEWNPGCVIQGSRLTGMRVEHEATVSRHLRLRVFAGVYHGKEQGNPLQPSAGRKGYITGDGGMTVRYQF